MLRSYVRVLLIGLVLSTLLPAITRADYTEGLAWSLEWLVDSSDEIYLVHVKLGARNEAPPECDLKRVFRNSETNKAVPDFQDAYLSSNLKRGDRAILFARKIHGRMQVFYLAHTTRSFSDGEFAPVLRNGRIPPTTEAVVEAIDARLGKTEARTAPPKYQPYPVWQRGNRFDFSRGSAVLYVEDTDLDTSSHYFGLVVPADEYARRKLYERIKNNNCVSRRTVVSLINYPDDLTIKALQEYQERCCENNSRIIQKTLDSISNTRDRIKSDQHGRE